MILPIGICHNKSKGHNIFSGQTSVLNPLEVPIEIVTLPTIIIIVFWVSSQ